MNDSHSFKQSFAVLRWYVRPQWKRVLILFVLLFLAIGLQLLQPRLLADFIDLATGEVTETTLGGLTSLTAVALLFILVALTYQLFAAAAAYVTQGRPGDHVQPFAHCHRAGLAAAHLLHPPGKRRP